MYINITTIHNIKKELTIVLYAHFYLFHNLLLYNHKKTTHDENDLPCRDFMTYKTDFSSL